MCKYWHVWHIGHPPHLVFLLERERKAIDDAAKNFKQLGNSVVALSLEDESIENVVDGLADEGAVDHELAIDAVEDGFEIVPFPRVLAVKEFQQLQDKVLVNVLFGNLGVCVIANHVAEQELIDDLQQQTRCLVVVMRAEGGRAMCVRSSNGQGR